MRMNVSSARFFCRLGQQIVTISLYLWGIFTISVLSSRLIEIDRGRGKRCGILIVSQSPMVSILVRLAHESYRAHNLHVYQYLRVMLTCDKFIRYIYELTDYLNLQLVNHRFSWCRRVTHDFQLHMMFFDLSNTSYSHICANTRWVDLAPTPTHNFSFSLLLLLEC